MAIQSKFLYVALLCIVGFAGVAASLMWPHPAAVELTTGSYLTPSRELPDFSLIDRQGRIFGPANLRGQWSVLFFGYTNCPDFCPATLTTLAAMRKNLRAAQSRQLPQVLFVSVDAGRDIPARMTDYVTYFDPEFIGLAAADQSSIEALAARLGVGVEIQPRSGGSYPVDHSSALFVLNPDGRLAAILTGPFNADALQSDFQHILAARGTWAGRA
ncbi:MAG: SCO family protein [Steroidobacteraceae bacterium]